MKNRFMAIALVVMIVIAYLPDAIRQMTGQASQTSTEEVDRAN